tara:strand:+ start:2342 stop:2806 length:465 start_codon:yes stop_codon:yes gene_type:complete
MVINFINFSISGAMAFFDIQFFGANHAQFSLLAILVFVLTETIVMYFFIATGKSIKNILIENNTSEIEKLWEKIKSIKGIIFPQIMLTITIVGTLYVFYFGYVISNSNAENIKYAWISAPLFFIGYIHHIWTLKIKNYCFKMQIDIVGELPNSE